MINRVKRKTLFYRSTYVLTLLSLFLIFLFLLFHPSQNIILATQNSSQPISPAVNELSFSLQPPALYPTAKINKDPIPEVSAQSYIVLDAKSDAIILSKNIGIKLKIASLTKLMTAIVSINLYKPEEVLVVKQNYTQGAIIGLEKNEKITFDSLLKALLIPSANDAAQVLADNAPQSFVKLMNEKAHAIHLNDTLFSNPQGFDDGDNYSTVLDLARLGEYALQFSKIKQIVNMANATIRNADGTKTYDLTTVNQLLFLDSQVHGIKTGYTEEAGECLMSLFEKDGHDLIIVVLKSNDRFGDSEALADYSFSNFIWGSPQEQKL